MKKKIETKKKYLEIFFVFKNNINKIIMIKNLINPEEKNNIKGTRVNNT